MYVIRLGTGRACVSLSCCWLFSPDFTVLVLVVVVVVVALHLLLSCSLSGELVEHILPRPRFCSVDFVLGDTIRPDPGPVSFPLNILDDACSK